MQVVLCNCPPEKAEKIARDLVERRVVACVNVIPGIKSFYHWDNKICEDQESTLLIKIRKEDFKKLEKNLKELHPYDVPEIVALNVANVNTPYIHWLYEMTK